MTIHWCGTGLSAIPGLRRLIGDGRDIQVWNRTEAKARDAVGDQTNRIAIFDPEALNAAMQPGDIVVSMLPGDWHLPLADTCLAAGAHFVSSSYISPQMAALDDAAKDAGLCFINEVGLDPGIDHLMAHWLMTDYQRSGQHAPENDYSFLSFCGGVPKHPNAFRYKFSWSPLGVLKALMSPSRSIRDYSPLDVKQPWDAVTRYDAPLDPPESFEVYPNRDSLPFMTEYGFEPDWKVRDFVRGTLRLNGWKEAWSEVFQTLVDSRDSGDETALEALSRKLLAENAYAEDEPDRVVLCVQLTARRGGLAVYDKTYALDAWGDERGSAMARLVSQTVALAVEAVSSGELPAGVSAAPSEPGLVAHWLDAMHTHAQHVTIVDHLQS